MKTQFTQEQIYDTAISLGIPTIPFFQRRIARAYDLVETNKVNEISHDDGLYRVRSQYEDKIYTVELNHGNPHCTCPDNERTVNCKHMIASMMVAQEREQKAPALTVKETAHKETVKASWVVTDGNEYTNVWQDLNGKICCVCGAYYKRDCIHKQAIRDYYDGGNGSKIVNDCGTETAKALQDKLNGSNGTGDNQTPVHHQLDTSNPFQECEQLDIDQIEGRSNGDLVHALSNGEYVISYRGIMKLAEQHGVTFEASRHDETRTVIAYGRCGGNSRASGKTMNGSFITAVELAKRNAARQLLPLAEIKALEKKAQLEAEFSWEKAKAKCLELVPEFKLSIIINDLVKDGTLRQAHPSDYGRREWLMVYDACKRDAETNGNYDDDNNDGGGDNPSPSFLQPKFAECQEAAKDCVRFHWLKSDMLKEGTLSGDWTDDDFAPLKESCEIDTSLFGRKIGNHWTIDIEPNTNAPWVYQRRYRFWLNPLRTWCFWCGETDHKVLRDRTIKWGRYEIKTQLCEKCHPTDEELTKRFDDLYAEGFACDSTAHGNGRKDTVVASESIYGGRKVQAEIDTNNPYWVTLTYDNGKVAKVYDKLHYEIVRGRFRLARASRNIALARDMSIS